MTGSDAGSERKCSDRPNTHTHPPPPPTHTPTNTEESTRHIDTNVQGIISICNH